MKISLHSFDNIGCNIIFLKKGITTFLFLLVFSTFTFSQTTFSWRNDQNPTSGQWNVTSYWWNGSVAALPGGGEILFLDGNVGLTMTNDLPSSNRFRILFGAGGSSRIVNGSTENTFYDFSGQKPKIENNSSVLQTINFPIKVGFNPMELNPINGDLTITSAINNNGNYIDVFGTSSKVLTISNDMIGNGGISLKQNSKIVLSTTAKTYTGATVLEAGTLDLSVSLGSNVTVKNTATLLINGNISLPSLTIELGGKVIISSGNSLSVSGALSNSAGVAGLVIESGGSLITNGIVSGSATVIREIPSDNKWHFISSPVSGQNISDGNFASTTFNDVAGATYDFYKWSEATVTDNLNWLNLKSSDWTLNTTSFGATPQFAVGTGYLVAYAPDFAGNTTKAFAGTLISGNQTIALTTGGNTYNLIGNPFASAINWDGVTKANLDGGYYYVYNEDKNLGAGYEYYLDATHKTGGANGMISSTQGFLVKASGTSLIIPNDARIHNNNWMKSSQTSTVDPLVITFSNGTKSDEAFILFEDQGKVGKDFFDAEKLMSMNKDVPQVFTIVENNKRIAFNSIPFKTEPFSIPLGLYIPADGPYSINISGLDSFTTLPGILLKDTKLNTTQDLAVNPVYEFDASKTDDPNRFVLSFNDVTLGTSKPNLLQIKVYSAPGKINISGVDGKAEILVRNMMGQVVLSNSFKGSSLQSLSTRNLPAGVYVVSVVSGKQTVSEKVVVK